MSNGVDQNHAKMSDAVRLTKWKKEPPLKDLQADLEASKPSHDRMVERVRRWNDLRDVDGSARIVKVRGRSSVQPRLIRRQAEWRYSALTEPFNSAQKLFDVTPRTFEDGLSAKQNELVLNYQFDTKINRVGFIDQYIRATVDDGTSIIMVGWSRIIKKVPTEFPVWEHLEPQSEQDVAMLDQANQARQMDPEGFKRDAPPEIVQALEFFDETGQVTVVRQKVDEITGQPVTETRMVEKVVDNRPTLALVDPRNFYMDPSCGSDSDRARFMVRSFETSQADLKKEPDRYKNLDQVNWAGAVMMAEPDHAQESKSDTNFNFKDPLRKRVVAYEYWGLWDIDGTGELKPVVCTWIGLVMIRCEANPFPDEKPPFILVPYMPVKREVMGEPDAELLEDNQAILGAVARGMIDLLGRSANAQQGIAKGMLDTLNRRRFDEGKDYEYNPNQNPNQGFIEHKFPEIPGSALQMLNLQNEEAEALTGVKAFSGGISGNAYGEVAANARSALDAASKREMAILRRLANGLVKVGRKIAMMNAEFLSDVEVIRITNQKFEKVKREDLTGEFDLKVDISTAEVDNAKAQDLSFMLQTIGPNGDPEAMMMILADICRLKRMPELEEKLRTFKPKPNPMAEKKAQLEIQLLEIQIAKEKSDIELNQAKAQKLAVEADHIDLDITEQETGTKHARDMDRITGQSQGNMDATITKALAAPKKENEKAPNIEAAAGYNELMRKLRDPRNSPGTAPPPPIEFPQLPPPDNGNGFGGNALPSPGQFSSNAVETPVPMPM